MTQSAKKKQKTKNTAQAIISGGLNVFEIRKFIRADNIVEAMNKDVQTPPSYIVMVEEGEEEELNIGFGT